MLVFLDTEFTGLSNPAHARQLLSLALVAEDGSAQWYAELDGWELADCDLWVQRHVVPLLTGPSLSRDAARASLQDWFATRPRSVQAACDSDIDWRFLLGLLGERPSNLAAQRLDLAPLIDTAIYNNTVAAYFANGHPEHHALHDARAYRLGWLAWMDGRQKVNAMLVFLDTEFTDLLNPELLSLGLVTLDGREHYAELDLTTDAGKARAKASSAFVQSGIFDMWGLVPGASGTEWEMGRRTGEWLLALAAETGTKVEVAFDYSTDYELMEYAIRESGLWDQVREVVLPVNVNQITGTITGELAAEECFRALGQRGGRGLKRHHALADALALRAAYIDVKAAALAHARKPMPC